MTSSPALPDGSAAAPINLYTEPAFLDVIASVFHAGRIARIRDYTIGGAIYRLLDIDRAGPQTRQRFIDVHESLGRAPAGRHAFATLPRLDGVAKEMLPLDMFRKQAGWEQRDGAPTVLWEGYRTWADYLALLHARRASGEDMRRGRRLRERFGDLEFRVDDCADDVLPTCFDWKSRRDLSSGREDLFADARNKRFFETLRERGMLRASTLRGDGRLLAIWLGAVHDRRWSGWVFAFDPDPALARYSLGQQLLYRMLEHSHGEGHVEFDFSIGMEPYKLKFATHVRAIGLAGRPAPAQQATAAMRQWLRRHPRLHDATRAMRRRLVNAAPASEATA